MSIITEEMRNKHQPDKTSRISMLIPGAVGRGLRTAPNDGIRKSRSTNDTTSAASGAESETEELRTRLIQMQSLIDSYQLQIQNLRKEMQEHRLSSIIKSLAADAPDALTVFTSAIEDTESSHAYLQIAEMLDDDTSAPPFLPTDLACAVSYPPPADEQQETDETAAITEEDEIITTPPLWMPAPEISDLESQLKGLHQEMESLRMQYDLIKKLSIEREAQLGQKAENLEYHLQKMEQEREELTGETKLLHENLEEEKRQRQLLSDTLVERDREIEHLKKRMSEVRAYHLAEPGAGAQAAQGAAAAESGGTCAGTEDLILAFEQEPTVGTILALRRSFLEKKQYEEGAATFRNLLIKQTNKRFASVVCLILGEFLKLTGKEQEAESYLSAPLVLNDSFARYLLRSMK
ncbi:MAG: hypothetical protein AB1546_01610 [bacterium]